MKWQEFKNKTEFITHNNVTIQCIESEGINHLTVVDEGDYIITFKFDSKEVNLEEIKLASEILVKYKKSIIRQLC